MAELLARNDKSDGISKELKTKILQEVNPFYLTEYAVYQVCTPNMQKARADSFCSAIKRGDIQGMGYFLSLGLDINGKTSSGWTPLSYALEFYSPQVLSYLLEKNADTSQLTATDWAKNRKLRESKRIYSRWGIE